MPINVSVHAVIKDKDKVLLIKRSDTGFWAIPGGRVEKNETIDQAVRREIEEECGVRIEITGICGLFSNPIWKDGIHTIVYLAVPKCKPKVRGTNEAKEIKYLELGNLPEEILSWHLDYIKSASSGCLIRNSVFKVRSPEDILEKTIEYSNNLSKSDQEKLKKEYVRKNEDKKF
ncbi:MAG: NUDIX hydrolase [Deltaproteobacteria bacterium]|nr:NUDIX hydrolase [Deltaproteobacteria bacterium]